MIHVVRRSRPIVIAAAVAALLGATALLSGGPASADPRECPIGEFCLYFNADADGGYHHFDRSDSNLNDDLYEGEDEANTVGDSARYVRNNGAPAARSNVLVYTKTRYRGARGCVEHLDSSPLPRNWWDNIESYRWVTRTECDAAGVLPPNDA